MLNGRHETRPQTLFRPSALERYLSRQEETVLPRYLGARTFMALWFILALLLGSNLALGLLQVPVYISGTALVTPLLDSGGGRQGELVVFLPPDALSIVAGGQPALVYSDGRPFETTVAHVETNLMNSQAVIEQFHLQADINQLPAQPIVVATVALDQVAGSESGEYRVDVNVGSRRLLSFLPFIGQLFYVSR